jgi:hypothetical protein
MEPNRDAASSDVVVVVVVGVEEKGRPGYDEYDERDGAYDARGMGEGTANDDRDGGRTAVVVEDDALDDDDGIVATVLGGTTR